MWSFFITNNRFAYLFLVALFLFGFVSVLAIPKESAPEVIVPVGIVATVLPGAPATDIEALVTNEIERGLSSLENVSSITSVSRESVSQVTVEFEADASIDDSLDELKDQIDTIATELPADAEDPRVTEVNFADQPILQAAISGAVADRTFTELADTLEEELEALPGVSRVTFSGVQPYEIAVIIDQAALLRYNLTLNQIITALRNANQTLPIGQIKNDGLTYNVAFEGDLTDSSDILNVGVGVLGGQPVYIRDIAQVEDGVAPASSFSRLSIAGTPSIEAITLAVYKQSGGDITAITRGVNERLQELQTDGGLLADYEVATIYDAGADILKDLKRLSSSGLQTVLLVVLLLVIAIGWREALLAGSAIPLSFLFGFIGLYLSGNTINFLSLFSLILGVGILVDSAIVMVEGINRRMKEDPTIDKRQAAIDTVHEFKAPLISGTLTTVSMFVGLFIVSGVIGQFIASIPYTLVFLLFASLFVSLFFIPLFGATFLKRRSATQFEQRQVEYAHKLESWYRDKLDYVLSHTEAQRRFRWGIRIALVLALLLPITGIVKVTFFEQSNVDFIIVEVEQPEGTTKEITDIAVRRVEDIIYTEADIESYTVTVGSGSEFGGGGTGEKLANFFVRLSPDRDRTSTEVVADLREKMAVLRDLKVTVNQPSDGPPTGAAIIVKFLGEDLDALTNIADTTAVLMRETEGIVNVETSTNNNTTEYVLTLDRAKAAAFGLDAFTISQIARSAVFGTDATSITTLTDDIDVVVKVNVDNAAEVSSATTNETTIDALGRIELPTNTGTSLPLSSLVRVSLRESSAVINHEDGQRVVSVEADVAPGMNAREMQTSLIETINNTMTLPTGITLSTGGGETEESNEAFAEMFLALVVGVLLMIGVLVLQFNSYRHMLYVITILPYSLIGIMTGLALTQNPLSFPSMMGFIALSGIVVNNSILLIDQMNAERRRKPEADMKTVVLTAASSRLRPILLTTATTVIGMLPLVFAGDLWAPLAYAVMFGLLFSVVITLVLIPVIYFQKPGELPQG